jgi:hypothetical protein
MVGCWNVSFEKKDSRFLEINEFASAATIPYKVNYPFTVIKIV